MANEKDTLNEKTIASTQTVENNDESIEAIFEEEKDSGENETATVEEQNEAQVKIADLEAKLEEKENRYLRLQADFDNSRRRAKLDLEAAQKYRSQSLIEDLLPVLDNFERALKVETDNEETKSVLQGMEMIHKGLIEAMKKEGVEAIEAVGKEFDPNFHQAVMQVAEEGFDSNTVVEEFQKGYILKDRVIRPSMVKVNQ